MTGEYGAVWATIGVVGATIDRRRGDQWLLAGAVGPLAVGVNYVVKLAIGRQRPLLEEHPPLAQAPTQAVISLRARDLVGSRRDRARPGRAARTPVPVRARGGDLHRASLSRACTTRPTSSAARRSASGSAGSSPGSADPPTEERLFDLAIDANEREQASRRAPGNGGAASPSRPGVGDSGPDPA